MGRTIPRIIIRPGITIGPIIIRPGITIGPTIMVRDTMDITGTGRLTTAEARTIIAADMAEATTMEAEAAEAIIMEVGAAAIIMEVGAAAGTIVADIAGRTS